MIDIGDFTPASAMGPTRAPGGATILGRLTTTEEQRAEAIERMTEAAAEHKESVVRAKIVWGRGEPTILEVTFSVEHLGGKRAYLPDSILEMTMAGGEFRPDESVRLRVLNDEIADMHERGML